MLELKETEKTILSTRRAA